MSHEWDSGFMTREPSWHRMERAVLKESPRSWPEAREAADLMWDVETAPVYAEPVGANYEDQWADPPQIVEGYQLLRRNDTGANLSIQSSIYKVIKNEEFGYLIDALLGLEGDEYVDFEALMSLYGGKQIVALVTFPSPLVMPWDPSKNYAYCTFSSRHDGQGGLRGIPTNVRVQCANTFNLAEQIDGRTVGFTIRHTTNWKERVAEMRQKLILARGDSNRWVEFTEQLSLWNVNGRRREAYLKRFLPISDDMGERERDNVLINRERIRDILKSSSCSGIAETGYGLLMASSEWSDHVRGYRSVDSYVTRQLLRKEPTKTKAAMILTEMAGVK